MSLLRHPSAPVRAPARRVLVRYHRIFEDLIHAVRNELVERLDRLDERIDDLEEVVTGSHDAIADQLAFQSASLRSLETELERLQDLTRSLGTASSGRRLLPPADRRPEPGSPNARFEIRGGPRSGQLAPRPVGQLGRRRRR